MPRGKLRPTLEEVKALLAADRDFLRPLVQAVLQELLEVEMTEALGAEKGERTAARLGYRSGSYGRTLVTRVGKLELRVPQDRQGRFSTELFERYQRSEKALVAALAEMDVQGVSTRKVKAITEELCGPSFSAAAISTINARLDEACPYLIVDARYERVREAGVIRSQAVLLAIGIGGDGRRSILAVELANRESRSSWREFLLQLRERGLSGVEFVVSDDHAGLRQAIVEVLPEAAWQRCYVGLLKNLRLCDPVLPDVVAGGDCARCPMRRLCLSPGRVNKAIVISDDHPGLLRVRRRRERWSEEDRRLYQRHRCRVEGVHGEAKTWHGLARAVRRGLANMQIQAYLSAAALNLKRLAAVLLAILTALWTRFGPFRSRQQRHPGRTRMHFAPLAKLASS